MKLSLLLCAAILFASVQGFSYVEIDNFNSQPPLILVISTNAPDAYWYTIYQGDADYAGPPAFVFHNTPEAISGQRDILLGHEGETPVGSVAVVSLVSNRLNVAFPLNYVGGVYVQWDGDDSAGGASAFPGANLSISPGIGSGVTASNPFSDGQNLDFTFGGNAIGVGLSITSDLTISYFLDAIDSTGTTNEMAFLHVPDSEDSVTRYFFRFTDPNWTNIGVFDWTSVAAFQVRIFTFAEGGGGLPNAVDTDFSAIQVVGYEVLGNIFIDCGCTGTATSFVSGERFNLFLASNPSNVIDFTFSDVNGDFEFTGLDDGTYMICIDDLTLDRCTPSNGCRTFTLANEIDPPVQTFSLNQVSGIVAPDDITIECGESTDPSNTGFAIANNCGGGSTTVSTFTDSGPTGQCPQVITRTFTDQGNTAVQIISIDDTTPPVISTFATDESRDCADTLSLSYNAWLADDGGVRFTDCSSFSVVNNAGAANQCGTTTVTFTATDLCGNQRSDVGTYTIIDNTAPVFNPIPSDATADCDSVGGTDLSQFNAWLAANAFSSASDDCSGSTITNNFVPGSLVRGCSESASVAFTATDGCGNTNIRTAVFTIVDATGPTFAPGAASPSVECNSNSVSSFNTWLANNGNAAATDDCGSSGIVFDNDFVGVAPFGCNDSETVTFSATDSCGTTAFTTGTFTVTDTTPPTITTFATDFSSQCDSQTDDLSAWLADDGGARATDACEGPVGFTNNFSTIQDIDCTSTQVTFTACDSCGFCVDDTANFSIVDNDAPFFVSGPFDLTVECGTDTQTAYENWLNSFGGSSIDDNCASFDDLNLIDNAPVNAPVVQGINCFASVDVTFRISDPCGNQSPPSVASFTVVDSQNPTITVFPTDMTVDCAPTNNNSYQTWRSSNAGGVATDVCSSVTWTNNGPASFTLPLGDCIDVQSVTFTASDACGNFVSDVATFTIMDNDPPVISTLASDDSSECNTSAVGQWLDDNGGARATDSCSSVVWSDNFNGFSGGCVETAFVTFTATDACGNAADTSATFSIVDTTSPSINPQAQDLTVPCDEFTENELTNWLNDHGAARATDACQDDADLVWTVDRSATVVGCDFEEFTFVVSDACGNSRQTTATFTSVDNDLPTFSPPPQSTTVECDGAGNTASYNIWRATHAGANAVDECALSLTFSNNAPSTGPTTCDAVIATFFVEDECGNVNSATASFVVQDTLAPTFSMLASNMNVECDGNGNVAARENWLMSNGGAMASDTCAGTVTWTQTLTDHQGDDCLDTDIYQFTASDNCGNSAFVTASFTVHDFVAPVITTEPSPASFECDGEGNLDDISAWVNDHGGARANDVCQGMVLWTNNFNGLGLFTCASDTITFTASDGCGNVVSRNAVVSVEDTIDPVFTFFPDDITIPCDADASTDVLGYAESTDVCAGDLFVSFTETSFDEPPNGDCPGDHILTRTFAAFDDCGNSVFRDQVITVVIARSSGPCDPEGCECDNCCPPAAPSDCLAVDCQSTSCRSTPCEASMCTCDLTGTSAKSATTIRAVEDLPLCKPVYIFMNDDDDSESNEEGQLATPPRMLVSNEALHL